MTAYIQWGQHNRDMHHAPMGLSPRYHYWHCVWFNYVSRYGNWLRLTTKERPVIKIYTMRLSGGNSAA